jgi:catechol 2,3-dioxygenase-like lactoylglutathione lyase family enzyme
MLISGVIPQLRTKDMASSIRFYTTKLGLQLEFQYQDFYAGIRAGNSIFHLKLVDEKDPSIQFVEAGVLDGGAASPRRGAMSIAREPQRGHALR